MTTSRALPVLPDSELAAYTGKLQASGAHVLAGSMVDMAGVARAKSVPIGRADAFHRSGMGAPPVWNAFCVDNAIAFTDRVTVVGDLRMRADLTAAVVLDEGWAWAPAELFHQDGSPFDGCARGRLRALQADTEAHGLRALVGTELEFVLAAGDAPLPHGQWQPYGLGALFAAERFVADLEESLADAAVPVQQLHAEYAGHQFEISLAPDEPLRAADHAVLARLVISRVARGHGLQASFSPQPDAADAGNGAHVHLSLTRDGAPLLSGGNGPHGLTDGGAAALAGIVAGLPDLLGVFAGSLLSAQRLQPGRWSGAFACWGLENREAAVRLIAATAGNPLGANVELKCVDPSANPYLALAALLGLALDGLDRGLPLPAETPVNPAEHPDAVRLPDRQPDVLDLLAGSALAASILGAEIHDALLAVRRHEVATYADVPVEQLAERFRFAWTS